MLVRIPKNQTPKNGYAPRSTWIPPEIPKQRNTRQRVPKVPDCPFPVLTEDGGFPSEVFVLLDEYTNKHSTYVLKPEGIKGLACFSTLAHAFARADESGVAYSPQRLSFEQAHELARSKPHVVCLFLTDDHPLTPVIHYVV